MLDLGLARTRVPVRRAREFIRRTKAEDDFMRRVVVVDIFLLLLGAGLVVVVVVVGVWLFDFGMERMVCNIRERKKNDEKVEWYYVCIYVLQWEDSEISVGTCLYLCCCEYDLQPELSSRLMIRKLISVQG